MQDYYNTIPAFGVGGLIAKIAKAAGRAKIQGHANLLSKVQPELSKLLSKLAKSQQGGPKLSDKEAERLATLAQNYRRSNIRYQNRRIKINEQIAAKRNPTPKPTEAPTEQTARSANPVPGTTLSSRWKQAKTWMNNHPKTTIGVPLLALGTGPGRYITGHAFKFTQSSPESWFGNSVPESETASDFVMIDGTKIPIKRSAEGYFVPVDQNNNQTTTVEENKYSQIPTDAGDDIDALINNAKGQTSDAIQDPSQVLDQQTINDLFDDDQWQ